MPAVREPAARRLNARLAGRRMRFLLTAFEPFDDTGVNSSLEGCRWFLEQWGSEFDVRFAELPVAYGPDERAVEQALAEAGKVDVLLHTGQHGGAAALHVERLAVNVRYLEDVVSGPDLGQQLIEPDGPAAVFATIPVEPVVAGIRGAGIPVRLSNHAGIYLCNHALYRSVRRAERAGSCLRVGFLHVPRLPEQAGFAGPSLTLDAIAGGIHAVFRTLAAS